MWRIVPPTAGVGSAHLSVRVSPGRPGQGKQRQSQRRRERHRHRRNRAQAPAPPAPCPFWNWTTFPSPRRAHHRVGTADLLPALPTPLIRRSIAAPSPVTSSDAARRTPVPTITGSSPPLLRCVLATYRRRTGRRWSARGALGNGTYTLRRLSSPKARAPMAGPSWRLRRAHPHRPYPPL